jgi:glycosyltransferase involved in cell wall biosynthesis
LLLIRASFRFNQTKQKSVTLNSIYNVSKLATTYRTPVIVSLNGQGNKELITNYENGFILDEPNVESFIEKILELHR